MIHSTYRDSTGNVVHRLLSPFPAVAVQQIKVDWEDGVVRNPLVLYSGNTYIAIDLMVNKLWDDVKDRILATYDEHFKKYGSG